MKRRAYLEQIRVAVPQLKRASGAALFIRRVDAMLRAMPSGGEFPAVLFCCLLDSSCRRVRVSIVPEKLRAMYNSSQ
jgi:hypothetical protein